MRESHHARQPPHREPFDRMLSTQAMAESLRVFIFTIDARFATYGVSLLST